MAQRAVFQTNTTLEGLFRCFGFLLGGFGFLLLVPPTVSVSILAGHLGEKSVTVFSEVSSGVKLNKSTVHVIFPLLYILALWPKVRVLLAHGEKLQLFSSPPCMTLPS